MISQEDYASKVVPLIDEAMSYKEGSIRFILMKEGDGLYTLHNGKDGFFEVRRGNADDDVLLTALNEAMVRQRQKK